MRTLAPLSMGLSMSDRLSWVLASTEPSPSRQSVLADWVASVGALLTPATVRVVVTVVLLAVPAPSLLASVNCHAMLRLVAAPPTVGSVAVLRKLTVRNTAW